MPFAEPLVILARGTRGCDVDFRFPVMALRPANPHPTSPAVCSVGHLLRLTLESPVVTIL
jgi:hypothetical protein